MEYKPKTAIKSQVLADFVADFSLGLMHLAAKEVVLVLGTTSGVWTLFIDGASNVKRSGLKEVRITTSRETLRHAIRTVLVTNNKYEYAALVAGIELARGLDSEAIEIKCDSELVVNQMYGIFNIMEECMQQYLNNVQALLTRFREWSIVHILREENVEAGTLANLGSSIEMKESYSGSVIQLLHLVLDMDEYYEVNSTNLIWD
ncbi:uncharacterized protein LOC142163290 [Nicotiana tabacum]|uniref:Uncharacterized protein LOC142163290 n=1 Tax=Nicotiana tabacum TaxID=4097 RepID=A0AC58RVA5_TOBAC